MGGKPADGNGRKGVTDRIKGGHAGQPVGNRTECGQAQINAEQCLGGTGDPGGQFPVFGRTGAFRPIQLHTADAEHGQDRNRQHDNADAAQPLQLLSVQQQGARQLVESRDDGGTGGGQSRHGLKKRLCDGQGQGGAGQKGHCPKGAENNPEHGGDKEAIPYTQVPPGVTGWQPQGQPRQNIDAKGHRKSVGRTVVVHQAKQHGRQHCRAEQHQQYPGNAQ